MPTTQVRRPRSLILDLCSLTFLLRKPRPIQASDILIDGFIALTFSPEDAQHFFALLLRTPDFLRHYRISYLRGTWYMVPNPPYFLPPPPGFPTQNLPLPLDYSITTTQGTVVPQHRWAPADEIDVRRYVESAALQLPVYFVKVNGELGFWLPDILQGRDHDLYNGNGEAPLGGRTTTHLRLHVSSHTLVLVAKILIHIPTPVAWLRFLAATDTHSR